MVRTKCLIIETWLSSPCSWLVLSFGWSFKSWILFSGNLRQRPLPWYTAQAKLPRLTDIYGNKEPRWKKESFWECACILAFRKLILYVEIVEQSVLPSFMRNVRRIKHKLMNNIHDTLMPKTLNSLQTCLFLCTTITDIAINFYDQFA